MLVSAHLRAAILTSGRRYEFNPAVVIARRLSLGIVVAVVTTTASWTRERIPQTREREGGREKESEAKRERERELPRRRGRRSRGVALRRCINSSEDLLGDVDIPCPTFTRVSISKLRRA